MEYADQLKNAGCKCIVLTSRFGILPSADLKRFAQSGVCVVVVKSDSGNANAMQNLLEWAHEHLPYPDQYVHAAGKSGFAMIEDMHDHILWDVAAPKVTELHLHFSQKIMCLMLLLCNFTMMSHFLGAYM